MNFNFGEVLTRAGQITWKHKNLWLAGIVIGLLGLIPAGISLGFGRSLFLFSDPSEMNRQMPTILLVNAVTIFFSILMIPIYAIAMTIPSLATLRLERGSETGNFGELIRGSLPYFWRILGIQLIVWAGMFVAMVPFMACTMGLSMLTFGLGTICFFPVIIALGILVFAMMEEGMAAVLVDDLGVFQALQRAWDLIKKNPGAMALMSIIIYLGSMIVSLILAVPMMIPMFGFMTDMLQAPGSQPDPQFFESMFRNMTWWMLAFSPVYAVLQGILLAFMQSAWTLTYLRLTRSPQLQPLPQEAAA